MAKRIPWATWKVEETEYKLKLTTSAIVKLEEEFKTNLMTILDGMPPLKIMLKVTHGAMQKFHHGIKEKDVIEIYDAYVEEGGSQTSFMTDVLLPIFQASGFFTEGMEETMNDNLEAAKEMIS